MQHLHTEKGLGRVWFLYLEFCREADNTGLHRGKLLTANGDGAYNSPSVDGMVANIARIACIALGNHTCFALACHPHIDSLAFILWELAGYGLPILQKRTYTSVCHLWVCGICDSVPMVGSERGYQEEECVCGEGALKGSDHSFEDMLKALVVQCFCTKEEKDWKKNKGKQIVLGVGSCYTH